MRSLEEIAANPREATISENLILVADPLGDYRARHGNLSQKDFDEIVETLKEHFVYGESLIARFRSDLVGLDSQARFNQVKIANAYDMLRVLLDRKPKLLDDRLAWLWRQREAIKSGRAELSEEDRALFELVHYTHQWHHFVTKKSPRENPFLPLQEVVEDGVSLYIRDNPNKSYPTYVLYTWIERAKTRERVVNKLLQKIFEAMEKAASGKDFYSQYFGEDQFGIRVVSFTPSIRRRVEGVLYTPEGTPRRWLVDRLEDYTQTQRKKLRLIEYMIRLVKQPDVPVPLQLQLQLYPHLLLDDFFEKDSHARYRVRREYLLEEYRKRDPKFFDRMKNGINQALSFLPE